MRFSKMITAVDSHTEGMPTRVVTSGFGPIPGESMFERREYVEAHLDHLRTLLMFEPRGHGSMSGAVLLPPTDPDADLGVLFIEVSGCLPMCGHGTIGTVTVAIETGLVPAVEPCTRLTLDTPAGRVLAEAEVRDGRVKSVTIQNVPSFLYRKDVTVSVPAIGDVTLDIAYGGNFYGILPAVSLGLALEKQRADALVDAGMRIMDAVGAQIEIRHPLNPGIDDIRHTMFTGEPVVPGADARNTVVIYPGTLDRSPCGTGTSARMAQLHARGMLPVGRPFVHESIIGSLFTGTLVAEIALTPRFKPSFPPFRAVPGSPASSSSCWIPPTRSRPASWWAAGVTDLRIAEEDDPAGTHRGPPFEIEFDGGRCRLTLARRWVRHSPRPESPHSGSPAASVGHVVSRGIGICFDCLVTIDGKPNQRACITAARPGMAIRNSSDRERHRVEADIAVVGGGPAGMAACLAAGGSGMLRGPDRRLSSARGAVLQAISRRFPGGEPERRQPRFRDGREAIPPHRSLPGNPHLPLHHRMEHRRRG